MIAAAAAAAMTWTMSSLCSRRKGRIGKGREGREGKGRIGKGSRGKGRKGKGR